MLSRTALLGLLAAAALPAQTLDLLSVSPQRHTLQASPWGDIVLDFDQAIPAAALPPTGQAIHIGGAESGPAVGTYTRESGGTRVRFSPTEPFFHGERVTVRLGNTLQASSGQPLRAEGHVHQFTIGAHRARMNFALADTYDPTLPSGFTIRIYGGQAFDPNDDGWVDLALVNEASNDVRLMPNSATGDGLFLPHLTPTNDVNAVPSPSGCADLNGDGRLDMVTANTGSNTVSVLFGNGDGTFQVRNDYIIGASPHGLALLDLDGDGDVDIAGAATGNDAVGLLFNDGLGSFGGLTFFEGGGNSEWGLGAADMNNDGIEDLVVGMRASGQVAVHLSNGDGTFTPGGNVSTGQGIWMIVLGDVNGDGAIDVTAANGTDNTASILMGNGSGGLGSAAVYGVLGHTTATDLGDLDGDGDLDWVLSQFGGFAWQIYENDGAGNFTLQQAIPAPSNPACALITDTDKDGDLDLILLDEIADVVLLYHNESPATPLCYGDGSNTLPCPCGNESGGLGAGCENSAGRGAVLLAEGTTSVAADDLVLVAEGLPPNQFGLVFSGTAPTQVPFGDGLRCLGGSLVRYPPHPSGAGGSLVQTGVVSFAFSGIQAGQTRWFECWYRDPGGTCGSNYNGSSALQVVFAP